MLILQVCAGEEGKSKVYTRQCIPIACPPPPPPGETRGRPVHIRSCESDRAGRTGSGFFICDVPARQQ